VGKGSGVLRPEGYRLRAQRATVRMLIRYAYGQANPDGDAVLSLPNRLVAGGPAWIGSSTFDIEAKLPSRPTTPHERTLMMRALLEERFELRARYERREMPVYALVRAGSTGTLGERLQPHVKKCVEQIDGATASPTRCGASVFTRPGHFFGTNVSIPALSMYVSDVVDGLVIDRTDLAGRFDFEVRFAPAPGIGPGRQGTTGSDAPSMFTALQQQLGLKLEGTRAAVDVLVIDSVQQPTGN
jgi:uncharacterized protein (TIGR03435 family)